jgi:hypothetical protein
MNQHVQANPDFKFIGPSPMDFDKRLSAGHCVEDEVCKLDIGKEYTHGIRKIGIIFNLDPHDKPGSHWVALYCCMKRNHIYYWDSYGEAPSREIVRLMERLQRYSTDTLKSKLHIKINKKRHQYKGTECGVYCLHFIIELLKGRTFESITRKRISDEQMLKYRKILYTTTPKPNA